jgi:methylmalonyl-CoA/ethylmalonyl-CoA epimerase
VTTHETPDPVVGNLIRRLDHVGVAVRSTSEALEYFSGHLGLAVTHTEDLDNPPVRLTLLDAGNVFVQLLEPLEADSELSLWIETRGEGVHHICFAVDDVASAVTALGDPAQEPPPLGSGRGRVAGFIVGARHNVLVECTEFHLELDVLGSSGWLPGAARGDLSDEHQPE